MAERVAATGFVPDVIVAIARGGLGVGDSRHRIIAATAVRHDGIVLARPVR